jgi:hypothetical protein
LLAAEANPKQRSTSTESVYKDAAVSNRPNFSQSDAVKEASKWVNCLFTQPSQDHSRKKFAMFEQLPVLNNIICNIDFVSQQQALQQLCL